MSDTAYNEGPAMAAARGQTYGKNREQLRAQQAVPMRRPPTDIEARRAAPAPVTPLGAPTARPTEPITSGAPFGPGLGPVAAGIPSEAQLDDDAFREMQAIYEMYPSQELADIIQFYLDARQ
jgi:hypothetical protein